MSQQSWPPLIDYSGEDYDPIVQGVDSVFVITYAPDEELEATDKFSMVFGTDLKQDKPLNTFSGFTIDMDAREVTLVVDGEKTQKWFKGKTFAEDTKEFPVFCQFGHTDAAKLDRPDSGIQMKHRFLVTVAKTS